MSLLMIVSICTSDHQALGSHKEHTPGYLLCAVHNRVHDLWESKAAADLIGGGAQVAMWGVGVAVHTDDALLTPAMWPGSWQGLGTPVLHHPYLVWNRFIKQLDISLICLRRVGYDLVTEWLSDSDCVSWSDAMPLPWSTFPVAFNRCAMFTFCALDLFSFLLTFKYHHDWEISTNIKGRALEKKVT